LMAVEAAAAGRPLCDSPCQLQDELAVMKQFVCPANERFDGENESFLPIQQSLHFWTLPTSLNRSFLRTGRSQCLPRLALYLAPLFSDSVYFNLTTANPEYKQFTPNSGKVNTHYCVCAMKATVNTVRDRASPCKISSAPLFASPFFVKNVTG